MNARELFEWAIRAEVKREWKIDGFGAVDARWLETVKNAAGSLAFKDFREAFMEASLATLLPMKVEMEAIAARAVEADKATAGG